jgi:hypothetical protein
MGTSLSRSVLRTGALASLAGAVCSGVGNLVHPVTPRDDEAGVAAAIAGSAHWTTIHLVIAGGILLLFVGLVTIGRSISGPPSTQPLVQFGIHAAIIGTTVGLLTVILDGVAAKQLANQWSIVTSADKAIALANVSTNETINFAVAGLFNMTFAGFPFILIGSAMTKSDNYGHWFGWIAILAGCGSGAAGLFQSISGVPTTTSLVLTIVGPTVIVLWMASAGVMLWRQSPDGARLPLAPRSS